VKTIEAAVTNVSGKNRAPQNYTRRDLAPHNSTRRERDAQNSTGSKRMQPAVGPGHEPQRLVQPHMRQQQRIAANNSPSIPHHKGSRHELRPQLPGWSSCVIGDPTVIYAVSLVVVARAVHTTAAASTTLLLVQNQWLAMLQVWPRVSAPSQ
jgi:hypothetical protein